MLRKRYFQEFGVAVAFSTPCVSLVNALIFTIFTTSCWSALKKRLYRERLPGMNDSRRFPNRVTENTRLFSDSSARDPYIVSSVSQLSLSL
eukprot:m.313224 g.313224  ORF g.313224 m.313224 type:complete len:91 (+) comp366379_c0_seq1:428-700(+)